MTDKATFTLDTAKRVIRATRAVEAEQMRTAGSRIHGPRPVFSQGGAALVPVVVRTQDYEDESRIVSIVPVVEDDDAVYLDDSKQRDMWCWYGLRAKDYAALAWPEGEYEEGVTNVLWATKPRSKWRVAQVLRFDFPLQDQRFSVEGCWPVIVPW